MNTRSLTIAVSTATLLLLIIVAGAQNRRASTLHAEQLALLTPSNPTTPTAEPTAVNTTRDADSTATPASPELLQLRSQVGQLMQRRRELQADRAENERLRGLVATHKASATNALPANYIRMKQARWMGQNTPENSLESFLWALQNRNFTNLVMLMTPRAAAQLTEAFGNQQDEFFDHAKIIPGMRIVDQERLSDGKIAAKVEIIPGEDMGRPFIFQMIGGQWKMEPGL